MTAIEEAGSVRPRRLGWCPVGVDIQSTASRDTATRVQQDGNREKEREEGNLDREDPRKLMKGRDEPGWCTLSAFGFNALPARDARRDAEHADPLTPTCRHDVPVTR